MRVKSDKNIIDIPPESIRIKILSGNLKAIAFQNGKEIHWLN